jgi:CheY-like chemotaxis protein
VRLLLDSLADMLRRTLDQRIRIEVDVPHACPPVLADPGQLESALLNIAINARDAMPEGGLLRFGAEPGGPLPAELRRELGEAIATQERFVAISLMDTGAGMPDVVRERAFEPFFTTKEAGRGTGLGLSTVYGFVKQSKGAIAIDSALGAGTTITLYIPRPWEPAEAAGNDTAVGGSLSPGLKVLLVEDDTEVRKVVRTFLDALGCEVTTAASGEQALLALASGMHFELLLTDIALGPGMRGTQLAAEAQQRLPTLAILLMSGFSAELLDADRQSPQGWELLRKPYSRAELARAITKVIDGRAPAGDPGLRPA